MYSGEGAPPAELAAYRAMSAGRSRNYDRAQDISPRQLVTLLEVCERTGTSLGQALATGEHESARTWNDHVRPTLKNGNLGSATGVWQFQPATFHRIVQRYGTRLLAASEADPAAGRGPLDLGEGPFDDARVRAIVRETVDGKRGAEDESLQLLRHNFAVLAFAKHYLSLDTGATTPEEDYLYHFLGAGQGKRILALARGPQRDTLCVKPPEVQAPELEAEQGLPLVDGRRARILAQAVPQTLAPLAGESALVFPVGPRMAPPISLQWVQVERPDPRVGPGPRPGARTRADAVLEATPAVAAELALFPPLLGEPAPVSADYGLPADSPTVTGNLGMFYRDGRGQSEPYTWAEFLEHLGRRVRAKDQPALVRAKYGVGLPLKGGDMPGWAFDPELASSATELRHGDGRVMWLPEGLAPATLSLGEARQYKVRLAELVALGEDRPLDSLPPEARSALVRLGLLGADTDSADTSDPRVHQALERFRALVGKAPPDDPAHADRLMPAERVALEIYGRRLAHFSALQLAQQAGLARAPDLRRVNRMPKGLKRSAAPHLASVQQALATRGLLTQPTQKTVWRDKKRRKHVDYRPAPFPGKPDQATLAALDTFQLRQGLARTQGVLDPVTLGLLGLPPLGPEIFLPPSGPQSPIEGPHGTDPLAGLALASADPEPAELSPARPRTGAALVERVLGLDCISASAGPCAEASLSRSPKPAKKKGRR